MTHQSQSASLHFRSTHSRSTLLRRMVLLAFALLAMFSLSDLFSGQAQQTTRKQSVAVQLGERLFRDARFSTSKGDLPASCVSCHMLDEDPQGTRAYADFFNRSWFSYRMTDPHRFMLRNSPTIIDAAQLPRLHYDGEFGSLEDLVKGTLAGRPMGWLPGEEAEAFAQMQKVVLNDRGDESGANAYRELFRRAYNVELDKLSRDEIVQHTARAVADFIRSLSSPMQSPYDQFVRLNALDVAPARGESNQTFAQRTVAKLAELERSGALKLTKDFKADALQGWKIFLRTEGTMSVGNCIACHAPPLFTDGSFHNLGISQIEYDQMHGAGKFAELKIPNAAEAVRPATQFREIPSRAKPGAVDLGYWNFVDLKTSSLRRAGESDNQLLERMIGAIKTPTLRHLAYSQPYYHNGTYTTLEDTLKEKLRLSRMARDGMVRAADEELKNIRLNDEDIPALVAFLQTLSEPLKRRY